MRNYLLSLFLLVACAFGALADTQITFYFNFDNPDAISRFQVNFQNVEPKKGTTGYQITIPDNNSLGIYTLVDLKPGYIFTSVTQTEGATVPQILSKRTLSMYVRPTDDMKIWTVQTAELSTVRTGSLTMNIDNTSKIRVREDVSEVEYDIQNGENNIRFIPGEENTLTIIPQSTYEPLYRVEVNGSRIPVGNYGRYSFVPHEGDVVNVLADFPDIDFPVHFTYEPGAEKVITSVSVNNQQVEGFDGKELSVKAGHEVFLRLDDTNFQISKISINGVEQSNIYSSLYFTPLEETTVYIAAHPYGDITAYITIDDPANAIVYQGYAYDNKVITLQPGRNAVALPERSARVCVWHSGPGRVVEISDGTKTYEPGEYNLIQLADGMNLNITTAPIVRDKKVIVWLDARDVLSSFTFNLGNYDFRTSVGDKIQTGYNELLIDPAVDNPATLSWWLPGSAYNSVYVDGELISPSYSGGSSYNLPTLDDGKVIRIYASTEAQRHATDIRVADGIEADVAIDRVTPVADLSAPLQLLAGTEVRILPSAAGKVAVARDGEPLQPGDDGAYTFVADRPSVVTLEAENGVGVDSAIADDAPVAVYNMQGVMLFRDATPADINSLPAGIYVIAGKKTVVK